MWIQINVFLDDCWDNLQQLFPYIKLTYLQFTCIVLIIIMKISFNIGIS